MSQFVFLKSMSVTFHELEKVKLPYRKVLKNFIQSIFLAEGKKLETLSIIFCSDEYLLNMNKQHLNHDFYTDIITFDLSESKNSPITGEIYISTERVEDNAQTNKLTFHNELHRVIFHGALHLCGFKDKNKLDITQMRKKEDEYLIKYGL